MKHSLQVTCTLFVFIVSLAAVTGSPAQSVPNWFAADMESRIGTWVADNVVYKSENEPYDEYAIEWTWGLGKASLVGRLFGITAGKEAGTFWEFRRYWDPAKEAVVVFQIAADGTVGTGAEEWLDGTTVRIVQEFRTPGADSVSQIGHQSKLGPDSHDTRSFDITESGEWAPRRAYAWRRRANFDADQP